MSRIILFCLMLFGFSSVPAIAASDAQSMIDAGNRQWSEGKIAEAEASFRQAIASDPDSSVAYARIASLYLIQNRADEAISNYQEAIMRDAENPHLFLALSIVYLHQGHYEMAQAMVEQALRLNPQLKDALKMQEYIQTKQQALTAVEQSAQTGNSAMHP